MKKNNLIFGLLITLTYALLAFVSLKYFTSNGSSSIIWLPSGLALATLLIKGARFWPAVYIGAFLCNYMILGNVYQSGLIAIGNTAEAFLAYYLVRQYDLLPKQVDNINKFILFVCIAAATCLVSAVNGTAALLFFNTIKTNEIFSNLLHWWQGDFFGIIFLAPLLIELRYRPLGNIHLSNLSEFLTLFVLACFFSYIFFLLPPLLIGDYNKYGYLLFVFIIWAAFRFGLYGSLILLNLFTIIGLLGITHQKGIYYSSDINQSLAEFWLFLITLNITAYVVSISVQKMRNIRQALFESEERYRQTLESTNHGTYDLNVASGEMFINDAYGRMLGYKPGELQETHQKLINRLHPEDKQRVVAFYQDFISGKHTEFRIDFKMQTKQKTYVWIQSVCAIASYDDDYFPTRMVGTHLDITHQKQFEMELLESNDRYKALIDNLPFCVHEINMEGKLISMNKGGLKMLSLTKESDVLGFDYVSLSDKSEVTKVESLLNQALNGKTSFFEFSTKNQASIYSTCFIPLFNEQKKVYKIMGYSLDITEQKQNVETIWKQANFDGLTKLPNRNYLNEILEQKVKESRDKGANFAIMLIDLDRFKEVNDSLGHPVGDALLIAVSERIASCVPKSSMLGRLGGDEFCLLVFDNISWSFLENLANKIISAMNRPFHIRQEALFITASIGIAQSDNVDSISELLQFVDLALYEAKNRGKNQYCNFQTSIQETFNLKNKISRHLRAAIENKEFILYYQPIINIDSMEVDKVEVLLRWQHPEMGLLKPDEFIAIAEETGQIIEIGYYVMEEAFKQLKLWRKTYSKPLQLSINKSPIEICNSKRVFIDDCFFLLDKYNLPVDCLNIEITENALLNTDDDVIDIMLSLKDASIEISLDDFGTGYSSLAYLNHLDIDYLKIDKCFIDNISQNHQDFFLCKAIISMAHTLGLCVIAEGVATQGQFDLLSELSCDYVQGFLFSKPIGAFDFESKYLKK